MDTDKSSRLSGKERAALILDAFESLLEEQDLISITIAKVAERAGVKRTLVYHFFPNLEAMATALTERYCAELKKRYTDRLTGGGIDDIGTTFGGITRIHAEFLNENVAAAKLLLGGEEPVATLRMHARPGGRLARIWSDIINAHTDAAHSPESEKSFPDVVEALLEMTTALFSFRKRRDGRISEQASDEAAQIASEYLKRTVEVPKS